MKEQLKMQIWFAAGAFNSPRSLRLPDSQTNLR